MGTNQNKKKTATRANAGLRPDQSAKVRARHGQTWPLYWLTTSISVVIITNMKATLIARTRIVYSEQSFAELVLWRVPASVAGSTHEFKYRLAYVVNGVCVVRYDNELGKGDHCHYGEIESKYAFITPEALLVAFERDIVRWNRENSDS